MELLEIEKALLRRPDALKITRRINKIIDEEKKERQHFYQIVTEQEKAEFVNGEIVYHSPVKIEHNMVCGLLFRLLSIYVDKHNLGFVGMEKILITLERNDYEPDIVYFTDKKSSHFKPGQMFFPAPDLVVEVLSESTESRDRGVKFTDYETSGVSEYWIIDPFLKTFEQYQLVDNEYQLIIKTKKDTIKSFAIQGLAFAAEAVFTSKKNLAALQKI